MFELKTHACTLRYDLLYYVFLKKWSRCKWLHVPSLKKIQEYNALELQCRCSCFESSENIDDAEHFKVSQNNSSS